MFFVFAGPMGSGKSLALCSVLDTFKKIVERPTFDGSFRYFAFYPIGDKRNQGIKSRQGNFHNAIPIKSIFDLNTHFSRYRNDDKKTALVLDEAHRLFMAKDFDYGRFDAMIQEIMASGNFDIYISSLDYGVKGEMLNPVQMFVARQFMGLQPYTQIRFKKVHGFCSLHGEKCKSTNSWLIPKLDIPPIGDLRSEKNPNGIYYAFCNPVFNFMLKMRKAGVEIELKDIKEMMENESESISNFQIAIK